MNKRENKPLELKTKGERLKYYQDISAILTGGWTLAGMVAVRKGVINAKSCFNIAGLAAISWYFCRRGLKKEKEIAKQKIMEK